MSDSQITGFALSPQQQRILALDTARSVDPYVTQIFLEVKGGMDLQRLQGALSAVVARHEILRTRFVSHPGLRAPLQVVEPEGAVLLEFAGASEQRGATNVPDFCSLPGTKFDLAVARPLRAVWFQRGENVGILCLSFPAVCADAGIVRPLVDGLTVALSANGAHSGSGEELQYADAAE